MPFFFAHEFGRCARVYRGTPAHASVSSLYAFAASGVTEIWYLPALVNVTDPATRATREFSLTPVYATVRDH